MADADADVEYAEGMPCWAEAWSPDLEAGKRFYAELFGYGMRQIGDGEDFDFRRGAQPGEPVNDEQAIGARAVMRFRPPEMPAHFLTCFATADCDEAVRTTSRLCGVTAITPQETLFGRAAVLVDNQGARFAVIDTTTAVRAE